ncbi:MAG TPA: RNA 3'-terminal phosphate cyclase [Nitrosopumilaceae archaeon]|nr:RNA 3'-terminal phosphate cyclase [Nitrosopumilaceae archaeon]
MESLKIDGSYGEGGGQIIRTAVTLSSITGIPVEIENIRKGRDVSGLRPQHLTGIKILAKICNAKVEGLHVGSTALRFFPSKINDATLDENVGTAGSIPLILQVLIPAVSISKKNLNLSIMGGTDVAWSPTSNYTKFVLKEAYSRIGINFSMNIKKRGYYPKGGGLVNVQVLPFEKIRHISLLKRTIKKVKILCSYSMLSKESIENEINEARNILESNGLSCDYEIKEESALDKGCSFLVFAHDDSSIIGSDAIYNKDMKGIGHMVAARFLESDLGVDYFLSDMLVIPLALTSETSVFRVKKITKHLETNLFVTSKFTNCKYGIGKLNDGFEVRIEGNSDAGMQ